MVSNFVSSWHPDLLILGKAGDFVESTDQRTGGREIEYLLLCQTINIP
jgi:hypothetical protein